LFPIAFTEHSHIQRKKKDRGKDPPLSPFEPQVVNNFESTETYTDTRKRIKMSETKTQLIRSRHADEISHRNGSAQFEAVSNP
jgi:hypothetical protein